MDRNPAVRAIVLATERALAKQGAGAVRSVWHAPHVCRTEANMEDGATVVVLTSRDEPTS